VSQLSQVKVGRRSGGSSARLLLVPKMTALWQSAAVGQAVECEHGAGVARGGAAAQCRVGQLAGPSGRACGAGAPLARRCSWLGQGRARNWHDRDLGRSAACGCQRRPADRLAARAGSSQAVATSVLVEEVVDVSSCEHGSEAARGTRFDEPRTTHSVLQEVHSVLLEVREGLEDLAAPVWSADGFTPFTVKALGPC